MFFANISKIEKYAESKILSLQTSLNDIRMLK